MRSQTTKWIHLLLGLAFVLGGPVGHADSKTHSMNYLKSLQDQNRQRLHRVETRLTSALQEIHNIKITDAHLSQVTKDIQRLESDLVALKNQQKEFLMRQDFFDRLAFQINTHFNGGPMNQFLVQSVKKMAHIEATSPAGNTSLMRFLNYLALALQNISERNEDSMAFVEGYINFSSLTDPIRPDQFVAVRDYTNGRDSAPAATVSSQDVGEVVEGRLAELKALEARREKTKVFELRQPVLKGVTQMKMPEQTRQSLKSEAQWSNNSMQKSDSPSQSEGPDESTLQNEGSN